MTTATSNPERQEELTLWQKIGYGLGDIYGGGAGTLISFYYLIFLTDVVRISPSLAGTVILISKIYDSVTDPFEGLIADRTRTRWGRRRPYLMAGIPLVFISFFLLFYPIDLPSETQRFIFVIFTYLFFSTVVSIVMLSYNALQSEMTLDYNERTTLSSVRIFFSTVGSILAALAPLEIVKLFTDTRSGWIAMGLIFGAIWAIPFIATVITAREREDFQTPFGKLNWREAFIEPFKVRTFVIAMLMYLLAFVAIDAVSSIVAYYMRYYLGRGSEISFVNGTLLIFQVISLPFYDWLSKRSDKKTGYMIGAAIWMVTMLFSFTIAPGSHWLAIYIFAAIVGIGTGGVVVMSYAIFPDIPDVDELQTGKRREGLYAALRTLVRKISAAFALFAVSNAIGIAGYLPPVEEIQGGVEVLVEQVQSAEFISVLRFVFAVVPVILLSLAVIAAWRYPLSPSVHGRLKALLAERRSDAPITEAMEAETRELEKLLIG